MIRATVYRRTADEVAAAGVRQPFLKGEVMNQTSFGKDNKGVEYTLYSFTNKNNF